MNQYVAAIHGGVSALMLIIVGYICTWLKFVPLKDFSTLNLYTAKCCFFFMTFKSLAGKDKTQLDFRPLLVSTLMSLSLYILMALLIIFILPKSFFKAKQTDDTHQKPNQQINKNIEKEINRNNENTTIVETKNDSESQCSNYSTNEDRSTSSSTPEVLFEEVITHPNHQNTNHHHHNADEERKKQQKIINGMNSNENYHDEKILLKKSEKSKLFRKKKEFDTPEEKIGIFLSTAFPTVYVNYLISGLPIFLSLWDESETAVITMMLITNEIVSLPILLLLSNFRRVYVAKKEIKNEKEKKVNDKINILTIIDNSNSTDQNQTASSLPSDSDSQSSDEENDKSTKQPSIDDNIDNEESSTKSNTTKSDTENIKPQENSEIENSNSAKKSDLKQEEKEENNKNNNNESETVYKIISNTKNSNIENTELNNKNDDSTINSNEVIDDHKDDDEEEFIFSGKKIALEILNTLIHNMFLVGIVAGFVYLAITSKVCTFLYQLMTLLSNCVLPFSLFSVGAYLSSQSLISCNWMVFLLSLVARLIVGPILTGLFCYALKFPGRLARQCIVIATMPTRVTCAAITENEGLGVGVSSTMIMWSCVFMVPAVVLWMWALNYAHLFED